MNNRNNFVEFFRFLFSLLVVGYHVQFSLVSDIDFFENGALAVEFFFLISGFFFAKSIDKIAVKSESNIILESGKLMKKKIISILPTHLTAIVLVLIVIASCDIASFTTKLVEGLPSIFLVQVVAFWTNSYSSALIVPEWYLSAMLICMLFMAPISILLRKKIKMPFVILSLLGMLGIVVIIVGFAMNWGLTTNFIYILRAGGEMCVGMFAYCFTKVISLPKLNKIPQNVFVIVEIICYIIPLILGFVPISSSMQAVCMALTVICIFIALSITFSGKGLQIKNKKVNSLFGYLGSISLAIYLCHPVVITLFEYTIPQMAISLKYAVVFIISLGIAVVYNFAEHKIKGLLFKQDK